VWLPLELNQKQKLFSEKQKGFRDGLSYSAPQKSEETRGNAITQPRSHPIEGHCYGYNLKECSGSLNMSHLLHIGAVLAAAIGQGIG